MILRYVFLFLLSIQLFAEEKQLPKEEFSETKHEITVKGKKIAYKAIAGNLILKKEDETPEASLFFVSYTKEGEDSKNRPITFCFNGGPGSASVWLHMGIFGPKRVDIKEGDDALPPYSLIENEFTLLSDTDLVFIDPVSTGYSRAIPPTEAKQFHGFKDDIKSIAEFIRLYITRYSRWDSPKFLAGESYGTTRAVGLAEYLYDNSYIYVNGIVLISSCFNFQSLDFDSGNDLVYSSFFPSYAATAWYHGRLAPELQKDFQKTIDEANRFVADEYACALFKGDLLPENEKLEIAKKMSRLIGLPTDYIMKSHLRVDMHEFSAELLKDKRQVVGRFDGRVTGVNLNPLESCSDYDPSFDNVLGVFTSTTNQYIRDDLKWERESPYKILANVGPWNYNTHNNNQYLNVSSSLKNMVAKNPKLRVLVANGYFDLATPYYSSEYAVNHLGLDRAAKDRISMYYYPAGHMMYLDPPSLVQLNQDLTNYYRKTLN